MRNYLHRGTFLEKYHTLHFGDILFPRYRNEKTEVGALRRVNFEVDLKDVLTAAFGNDIAVDLREFFETSPL